MKKFLIISMVALGLFSCKEDKKDSGNDGISVESITCSEHEVSIFRWQKRTGDTLGSSELGC